MGGGSELLAEAGISAEQEHRWKLHPHRCKAPTPTLTLGGLASSIHQWEQQEEESCRGERCEGGAQLEEVGGGRPFPWYLG